MWLPDKDNVVSVEGLGYALRRRMNQPHIYAGQSANLVSAAHSITPPLCE